MHVPIFGHEKRHTPWVINDHHILIYPIVYPLVINPHLYIPIEVHHHVYNYHVCISNRLCSHEDLDLHHSYTTYEYHWYTHWHTHGLSLINLSPFTMLSVFENMTMDPLCTNEPPFSLRDFPTENPNVWSHGKVLQGSKRGTIDHHSHPLFRIVSLLLTIVEQ